MSQHNLLTDIYEEFTELKEIGCQGALWVWSLKCPEFELNITLLVTNSITLRKLDAQLPHQEAGVIQPHDTV